MVGLLSVTITSLFIGALVGRNSIRSGGYFLNALIGTSAFGPLMYGGFTWYDETFLVGLLAFLLFRQIKLPIKDSIEKQKIYFVFLVYFLIEFFNGIFFFLNNNEDVLRKFRWLIYLILLLLAATFGNLDKTRNFDITKNHLWGIVLFLILYLVSNYFVLRVTGSTAYAQYAQVPERGFLDAVWANTAYVTLSIFIFMYVGMIGLIQKSSKISFVLSKLILFMSSLIFGLTLSRSGFFLAFLLLGAFLISQKGWKNLANSILLLSLIIVPMIIGLNASGKGNLQGFGSDIVSTLLVPFDQNRAMGRESDRIGQYNQVDNLAKYQSLESEELALWHRLFGYGLRTSGLALAIANKEPDQSKFSISFAPSIPIEFGLIGIVLFLSVIFAEIKNLFRSRSKDKLLVLALILGAVLTTTVVNNFDYIPLYMLLSGSTYLGRANLN